jgi:hypothetical protein
MGERRVVVDGGERKADLERVVIDRSPDRLLINKKGQRRAC